MNLSPSIAYFSMEIGLVAELPTYAGGLGVLAGDTIRSAADRGLDMVAVTTARRAKSRSRGRLPSGWPKCLRGPQSASRAAPCSCGRGAAR